LKDSLKYKEILISLNTTTVCCAFSKTFSRTFQKLFSRTTFKRTTPEIPLEVFQRYYQRKLYKVN